MNIVAVWLQSDFIGKVIVFILFGGSIMTWSVMISRAMSLKAAELESLRFLRHYRGLPHPVQLFLKARRERGHSPLQAVYDQACASLESVLEAQGIAVSEVVSSSPVSQVPLSDRQIHSVQNAAERTVADQALLLESNMGHLASAASAAPFLGLLGTVWGVMNAFGSMAGSGTALLSEVAPGISSALLTTVVGLLVALPSSIGYNTLTSRIRRLTVMMDNFGQELVGDLERMHVS